MQWHCLLLQFAVFDVSQPCALCCHALRTSDVVACGISCWYSWLGFNGMNGGETPYFCSFFGVLCVFWWGSCSFLSFRLVVGSLVDAGDAQCRLLMEMLREAFS
ncbi:MAG: hypothetical protein BYD32DRAFT_123691 [Podila humilis]|nr:MAG: hypothetical protein BYD32DRAFT_123691 [Podila humilis]